MTILTRRTILASGVAFTATPGIAAMFAPSDAEQEGFIKTLKTPGHALLLRHTLAPGHNDPGDFRLRDCYTQRNLNDVGRAQAVSVGEWLRARDVMPSTVYSSQWCRCLDTANLMGFEPVVEEVALNSISDMPGTEVAKVRRLKDFIMSLANRPGPAILVTHSNVASRLVGGLLGSGEGAVIRVQRNGETPMIGRVLFGMERM